MDVRLTINILLVALIIFTNSNHEVLGHDDSFNWNFQRWKLSDSPLVNWTHIAKDLSFSVNSAGTYEPSPEFFQILYNPCATDEIIFYIVTRRNDRKSNNVYLKHVADNDTDPNWINLTPAFCPDVDSEDCGSIFPTNSLIMTNDHLIALTNKGMYVSAGFNETNIAEIGTPYERRPLLSFRLNDPCEIMNEVFNCFQTLGRITNVMDLQLYHNPVCHNHQYPNFRDTITLIVEHTDIGLYSKTSLAQNQIGPIVAFSVLFSDAPYTNWLILVKSATQFKSSIIKKVSSAFYNHQANDFHMIILTREHGSGLVNISRIILSKPKFLKPYTILTPLGYQSYTFSSDFVMKRMQVMPISLDIFFYGNHLYIAESAGFLAYQSLSEVQGFEIHICSFGHPDKYYICTNRENSIILVGRVGSLYSPGRIFSSDMDELTKVAVKNGWIVDTTNLDEATKNSLKPVNEKRLEEVIRNSHFIVDYDGNIKFWYLDGLELKAPAGGTTVVNTSLPIGSMSSVTIQVRGKKIATETGHGSLVALPMDPTSCMLFEAEVPETILPQPTFSKSSHASQAGLNINCYGKTGKNPTESDCELYIRHIKRLGIGSENHLPGFALAAFTYVMSSIPMRPFHCKFRITYTEITQVIVEFLINSLAGDGADGCWKEDYVGWTLFIPGHFSILLNGLPLQNSIAKTMCNCTGKDCCIEGLAMKKVDSLPIIIVEPFRSALIDMSTPLYKNTMRILRGNKPLETISKSWELQHGTCNFLLKLTPNKVIKDTGVPIALDLQDFLTFEMRLIPLSNKAKVMLQRPLISLTNSNPQLLLVERNFDRGAVQKMLVVVRASGVGLGMSSVVVRTVGCSMNCETPCSHSLLFQLMRKRGRRLEINYPIRLDPHRILNPDPDGNIRDKKGKVIYTTLPVNYRPPSLRGPDIPLSKYIYNADPSKPKYKDIYRVSKETGEFGKCKEKLNKSDCECTFEDKLNDHIDLSDCRKMVFVVRRGVETRINSSYFPVMNDSDQSPIYFLKKLHLSVFLEEVNGRVEYSVRSDEDEYLRQINQDNELNLGKRYYDANTLTIACYASGLFHFKLTVGEFDSFEEVAGYFILYCDDPGLNAISFMAALIVSLSLCFVALCFGFTRLTPTVTKYLPVQGETDKIKDE